MIGRAEMIALARQYGKRRGLKWVVVKGTVRLLTPGYETYCPVTAACAEATGERFPTVEYYRAGRLILAKEDDYIDLATDADCGDTVLLRELNGEEAEHDSE